MHTYMFPPKKVSPIKAKLTLYREQAEELLQTIGDLCLAYEVASMYDILDARYYQDMFNWMNSKYGYVIDYAHSFPASYYEIN